MIGSNWIKPFVVMSVVIYSPVTVICLAMGQSWRFLFELGGWITLVLVGFAVWFSSSDRSMNFQGRGIYPNFLKPERRQGREVLKTDGRPKFKITHFVFNGASVVLILSFIMTILT